MRIGLVIDDQDVPLSEVARQAGAAAAEGFSSVWVGEHYGWDPLTALAVVGGEVPGIELGAAVVVTHSRRPLPLASQALTVQAATGGRLALGVGPSHRPIVEGRLGLSYDRPARHVREYVETLVPLLDGDGIGVPEAVPPPLLLSALGPVMLRIAGELADGTVTVWAGRRLLEEYVVPTITEAATAAGRARPRVAASLPVLVTSDPDGARDDLAARFAVAAQLPAYRAVLERGGESGPAEVALVGDEAEVERGLRRLFEAGVTDVLATVHGDVEDRRRTTAYLGSLADAA